MRIKNGVTPLANISFKPKDISGKADEQFNNVVTRRSWITGFSLVELIVVVGVIAVLGTLFINTGVTSIKRGRDARRISDLEHLRNALELFYEKNHAYPLTGVGTWYSSEPNNQSMPTNGGDWIPGLAPTFISTLPSDPSPGARGTGQGGFLCGAASDTWKRAFLYRSDDGQNYALLTHCALEVTTYDSNSRYYDSVRPTWAYKVCNGTAGCNY